MLLARFDIFLKESRISRCLAKTLILFSFLPMLDSCQAHATFSVGGSEKVGQLIVDRKIGELKHCIVDGPRKRITYSYPELGKDISFDIELVDGINLFKLLLVGCQSDKTIIVTPNHVVITLGYDSVLQGREMLGVFEDGLWVAGNAVALSLEPLGEAIAARISGEELIVEGLDGKKLVVGLDRPSTAARLYHSN